MASGVYAIRNKVNGKVYVGSSRVISRRWRRHRWHLRNGCHHSILLQRAWDKYGETAFQFEVLEEVDLGLLLEREQHWLDELHCTDPSRGYNHMPFAGSCGGVKHPDFSKRLIESGERCGERHPRSRFTNEEVLVICEHLDRGEHVSQIAAELGVPQATIEGIKNGHAWSRLTGRRPPGRRSGDRVNTCKIPNCEVPNILRLLNEGVSLTLIGKQYGVFASTVAYIRDRRSK